MSSFFLVILLLSMLAAPASFDQYMAFQMPGKGKFCDWVQRAHGSGAGLGFLCKEAIRTGWKAN